MESSCNKKYILVEYVDTLDSVITTTFQRMKRVKLKCFDISKQFIIFGASSGGIYIFRKSPCQFLKLIPSKEGSANKVVISSDEKNLGIASSSGLIVIIEDFCADINLNYQVYSEHEAQTVTMMKWHGNDLYCGDSTGRLSVISPKTLLSKAIFQTPSATLMQLDSCIVQIDTYLNFLLVSTKSKTYLCDTEKELFKQIGKKLREGFFGACFLDTSNKSNEDYCFPVNTRKTYTTLNDNEAFIPSVDNTDVKIYCARPGARLWEVNFEASVLTTRQFKGARSLTPPDFIQILDSTEELIFANVSDSMQQLPPGFNFGYLFSLKNKFIFTYDEKGIYIFDPLMTELVFWCGNFKDIKDIVIIDNTVYMWQGTSEIKTLSLDLLEDLILNSLFNKQYFLCAGLCSHYSDEIVNLVKTSKKLQLVSVLKQKINDVEVLENLKSVFDSIAELQKKMYLKMPPLPSGIVRVDNNGHFNNDIQNTSVGGTEKDNVCIEPVVPFIDPHIKLLYKQYIVNKTHEIDIPDVLVMYQNLSLNELFEIFHRFIEYVKEKCEGEEDATVWCHVQFLRLAVQREDNWKDLNKDTVIFFSDAYLTINDSFRETACVCGFPLPKCKVTKLKFEQIGKFIFKNHRDIIDDIYLHKIPYFYKFILSEMTEVNLPLLIQFGHNAVLESFLSQFTYDTWDETIILYNNLCNNACLNCAKMIDTTHKITWTDLGLLMIESVGPKNAVKLLQRHSTLIPKGELSRIFYQASIFTMSFGNTDQKTNKSAVEFMRNTRSLHFQNQFDSLMKQFLQNKFLQLSENLPDYGALQVDLSDRTCGICTLSLRSDILKVQVEGSCGHVFHAFCFNSENCICSICNKKDQC